MSYSPLTMKRRHVLGDICDRCDPIVTVPVYENDESGDVIGHVDESLGHYADAFTFHLPEDICKRLSSGQYSYSFGYEYLGDDSIDDRRRRIKITSICINERKLLDPVAPRKESQKTPAAS
jgi:hypothetical protein